MLRPSRPMMRPFRSSLGRSTTETVVSMACSAALRWMASVMICCARSPRRSRALRSRALDQIGGVAARVGFDLLEQQLARLVGGQPREPLQLALLLGHQLLVARRVPARPVRRDDRLLAARRSCSTRSVAASRSASARACRPAPAPATRSPAGARAPALGLGADRAPSPCRLDGASLRSASASRSACDRSALWALPTVSAAMGADSARRPSGLHRAAGHRDERARRRADERARARARSTGRDEHGQTWPLNPACRIPAREATPAREGRAVG